MAYWLIKSEPNVWSWAQQKARGQQGELWTGVRNYSARNNMLAMQLGDKAFFYHSNIGKEIVGIVEVAQLAQPDPTAEDTRWQCVSFVAVADMPCPVSLTAVKSNPKLACMPLVTHSRLSVQPVAPMDWEEICKMGGL